jgi:hypothetical protein
VRFGHRLPRREQALLRLTGEPARPELAEDREVESRVGHLQSQCVLPINPRPYGVCRLAV